MKIGIVGTGISGLTAAYLLSRQHEVYLFEANNYIGGHTNTIMVQDGNRTLPVDTGFIVFNENNYPNLCKMFSLLDVESRNSDMSFSVHCEKTGLEYNGGDLNRVFSQRKNLFNVQFLNMLKDIMRFHKQSEHALQNGLDDITTVSQFAAQNQYSHYFVEYYLVPLGASLWSCPAERFRDFPIRFVLEFLDNHCMLQITDRPMWKTVVGGSQQYIKPITRSFADNIYLNHAVAKIERKAQEVTLHFESSRQESFDEVIVACHADTSVRLMQDIDDEEYEMLSSFEYQDNEAVLHTDTSILPGKQRTWASWNYRIPANESSHVAVTYNMNMLQGLYSSKTYNVSLNQTADIDPSKVIKRILYHHPVFKPGRQSVQSAHEALIRRKRVSYCGAYWGFGFHEDGVNSALNVAQAFDEELH